MTADQADLFPSAPAPKPERAWIRHPWGGGVNRADYHLIHEVTGRQLGFVKWCGHPTANYPYYTRDREDRLRTFRTVAEAKGFVEAELDGRQVEKTE
jgi:hypothetical protein